MENQTQPTIEPPMPVQPAPQPIQATFEPTRKSLPKWPLIIVGVILIVILLSGAYVLGKNQIVNQKPTPKTPAATQKVTKATPTPTLTLIATNSGTLVATDTSTWKILINNNLGFSVKYPAGWYTSDHQIFSYDPSKAVGDQEGFAKGQFKFEVAVIPFSEANLQAEKDTTISKSDIIVDGEKATRSISWLYGPNSGLTGVFVDIHYKQNDYSLGGYYNQSEKDKYIEMFDEMVSTFKFTP